MGGKAVPKAANHSKVPVRALVASHGARDSELIRIPSLYIAAQNDEHSSNSTVMRKEFDSNRAQSKVFVETKVYRGPSRAPCSKNEVAGCTHEEPIYQGSMVPWVGQFFMCHLSGDQDSCNLVYGRGTRSLCSSNVLDSQECLALYAGSKICVQNSLSDAGSRMFFDVLHQQSEKRLAESDAYGVGGKKCIDLGLSGVKPSDRFLAKVRMSSTDPSTDPMPLEFDVEYRPDAGTATFECKDAGFGFGCELIAAVGEVVV
jgi:hypothetical protein